MKEELFMNCEIRKLVFPEQKMTSLWLEILKVVNGVKLGINCKQLIPINIKSNNIMN